MDREKLVAIDWLSIEEMPDFMKDGREVYVKRVHEGRTVKEGFAVFGVCSDLAPQRQPLGLDPLNRLTATDYLRENAASQKWAGTAKWLKPDRMYSFPTPTHYSPPRDEGDGR